MNSYIDICLQQVNLGGAGVPVASIGADGPTSTTWAISEAVIQIDTITLDSQLDNEYTDHLMSGKNIQIPFVSFVHQIQSMLYNKDPVISLSRAFTRLENVFVTFYKTPYIWTVNGNVGAKSNTLATHIPLR